MRRVCYIAQLALSGDAEPGQARAQLLRGIEQLAQVFRDPSSRELLGAASRAAAASDFYPALRHLRALMPIEERLLGAGAGPASGA